MRYKRSSSEQFLLPVTKCHGDLENHWYGHYDFKLTPLRPTRYLYNVQSSGRKRTLHLSLIRTSSILERRHDSQRLLYRNDRRDHHYVQVSVICFK